MNKIVLTIISTGFIIALVIIFTGGSSVNNVNTIADQAIKNVEIKSGIQYITVSARGGYSPRISTAKAGIPTKLIIKTNGTYDCSAALAIYSLGFQKILPQTGETVIDVGTPKAGEPLQGVCGMGMYSFVINFE